MKSQVDTDIRVLPVVPMDNDTRAMLAYAESPEGRARIEQARRELNSGEGIVVSPAYFDNLNRRIDKRRKGARTDGA